MKVLLLLFVVSILKSTRAGYIPASTSIVRSSSSIAHPSPLVYSHNPVAVSYSAPLAYSHPAQFYTQPILSHFANPVYAHAPVIPTLVSQYPQLIAQNPAVQQYPVVQGFPGAQYPSFGQVPSGGQRPVEGNNPEIEAADDSFSAGSPSFGQQPTPQPPQQSPILGGNQPGTTVDDDTVSIEAA